MSDQNQSNPIEQTLGEKLNTLLKKNFLSRLFYYFGDNEAEEETIEALIQKEISDQKAQINTQINAQINEENAAFKTYMETDDVKNIESRISKKNNPNQHTFLELIKKYLANPSTDAKDEILANKTYLLNITKGKKDTIYPICKKFAELNTKIKDIYTINKEQIKIKHDLIKHDLIKQIDEYINQPNKSTAKKAVMVKLKNYLNNQCIWANVETEMRENPGWDAKILYSQVENTVRKIETLKPRFWENPTAPMPEQTQKQPENKSLDKEIETQFDHMQDAINDNNVLTAANKKSLSTLINDSLQHDGGENHNKNKELKNILSSRIIEIKYGQFKGDLTSQNELTSLQNILTDCIEKIDTRSSALPKPNSFP